MLQQRQISKILQQGLTPIQSPPTTTSGSIKSISLLSSSGIPLITVSQKPKPTPTPTPTGTSSPGASTGNEDYKIYSILGYNSLKDSEGDDEWSIIQFEPRLKCLICTVLDMYLVLYFDSEEIGDEYVKVKSEGLASALREGLKGYNED